MTQSWWLNPCKPIDLDVLEQAQARQQQLTKPAGSLGQLEAVAVQLAGLQGQIKPSLDQLWIAIFAGDHGVVAEGVSAFPRKSPGRCCTTSSPVVQQSACWRGSWGLAWKWWTWAR
jgi:nicotinate-nucleotide--dimethylbenzimidazole phosphoribosyltransferase